MKIQKMLCSILICILLIATTVSIRIIDVYARDTNSSLVKNNTLFFSGNISSSNSLHHNAQYLASNKANKLGVEKDEDTWKIIDSKNQVPPYEVYLARTIIEGYGKGPTVYNTLINSDYPLVYQQLAKYAMEEKNLYYSSGLWLTYFDSIFKNCPRYAYEAILMSYLDYDADSSRLNNTMEENVNAFGIELMTTLLSSGIDEKVEENGDALKVKNQIKALPKDEAKTVLKEKVILEVDAGLLSGSINGQEDIPELITNLSVLNSADEKRKGQITFLKKMQKRIKDNDDLKAAIKDIVYSFESEDVISLWSQTGKQNVYMFGKVLTSAGWDKLIDSAGPEVALALKGVRLGGSGLNALFGTTTLSQDLMTILTLYIIDNEFKNTVRSLKENFIQNPNKKNAIAFNTAIDSYIEYQKFADFTAKQYVYDIINSGVLTETFTKIFYNENIKTAEELMARCDDNIRSRNKLYDITKTYYKNYCEENHLEKYSEAYDMLCEESNVWKITPKKKDDKADVNKERLKDLSLVAIYHCIEDGLDEWTPDIKDTDTFWDVMCFYCDFTDRIYSSNYPIIGEDVGYQAIPNNILKNVAYAIYKDFDGNLPTIDSDVWRANYYNDEATGIIVGDDAPIIITSEDYQQNEDGTIDAVYDIQYVGDFPAGTYKVHFEPNTHHNEVNADATFYYRVSRVELLEKPSIDEESDYEELTMEEFGIPYGYYRGEKPQGDGVFGLDMYLYEDMTYSIESSFDPFTNEDGDEYFYSGTYKVDRENEDGDPVLLFQYDEGEFELVWDGEDLINELFYVWYEGE